MAVEYTENIAPSGDDSASLLEELMREPDVAAVPNDVPATIQRLGVLIDLSSDLGRPDATEVAIRRARDLLQHTLTPDQRAVVNYYLSNAWEALRVSRRSGWALHEWEQPEIAEQIINLRSAARLGDVSHGTGEEGTLHAPRRCQIYTNLGNLMSHCGRIVDAVAYWDRALALDGRFAMAHGNRAVGLMRYARLLHDPGHQLYHLRAADTAFALALLPERSRQLHPAALAFFTGEHRRLRDTVREEVLKAPPRPFAFPDRMSQRERAYRQWCLRERLCLNDLNDLGTDPIAAADVLMLPDLTTAIDSGPPNALGFFNQLKQEFVSARYVCFGGLAASRPHFSDRDVTLLNTLDYPAYGLAVEQVKLAFRAAYSLLDKIAYFLNDHLGLQIPEKAVAFRKLWYERQDPSRGIRADLHRPDNTPLQALFWLAKDLYERDPVFADALEPAAREVAELRHHLEHKYLKIHLEGIPEPPADGDIRLQGDALAHSVTRGEFEDRTLYMLRLARSALLYVSMAVYVEEDRRRRQTGNTVAMPMTLGVWEDEWKC